MTSAPIYRRVLLKISGEALMGSGSYGLDLADRRPHRRRNQRSHGDRHRSLRRHRRRQHLPRIAGGRLRHGTRQRRLYGHAGDGDERARDAKRTGAHRRRHPRAIGHPDDDGLRALHSPPRHPPHGKGQGGDFRRRHRQSVLHDRHGGSLARRRNGRQRADEGHASRRRLLRRSEERSEGRTLRSSWPTWMCCRAT